MNKGTKQAIFILSLIPIMYFISVLFHSFTTWQAPFWSPALWGKEARVGFALLSLACLAYAFIFYDLGKDK